MSMNYYSFSEIGFIADNNLINYIKNCNPEMQECEDWVVREFMEEQGFSYDGDLIYSRLSPVNEKGINWPGCIEGEEEVYCYQLGEFPQLFKAAYNSLDEIVAEIKKEIGHLLPDNYDIAKHIYYVEGVYFG